MNYQHLMGYVAHITNSAGPLGPSLNDIGRLNQAQRSREDMLERRIKELDRQIAKIHRRLEELESRVLEARARQGVCP
jgi:DNA-binding transcriptional MerR regulator